MVDAGITASNHENACLDGEPFAVEVTTMSGKAIKVDKLTPDCSISELSRVIATEFGYQADECCHPAHELALLCNGTQLLDNMTSTLQEVGLQEGSLLTYVWTVQLVKLRLASGGILKVKSELASKSDVLMSARDDHGASVSPLPADIDVSALRKALEHSVYHTNQPPSQIRRPLPSTDLLECGVSVWDAEYIELPAHMLAQLIYVAKILGLQELLSLACAKIASMISCKSIDQIRQQFDTRTLRALTRLYVSHELTPWARIPLDSQ